MYNSIYQQSKSQKTLFHPLMHGMEQDRAREMDTGEAKQLQSHRRREPEHHPGIPGMLGGGHADDG